MAEIMPVFNHHKITQMGHNLASRGNLAVGKNIFIDPAIGFAHGRGFADCVQQKQPVRFNQPLHGFEKSRVVFVADMLEHADRDNFVIAAGQ